MPVTLAITGPSTVWYFNGAAPSGYATVITLTSSGGVSTQWTVVAGGDKVTLSNTSGTSTTLTSNGVNFSTSVGDIKITATVSGMTSNQFGVTSRAPYRLVPGPVVTNCDSTWGYATAINYTVQDRLLTALPTSVAMNELWTTPATNDSNGTNWRQPFQDGWSTQGATLQDYIQGEHYQLPPVPTPTCDGNSTPVQHWGQAFYVGSFNPGNGRRVQINTFQKYRGRAAHTVITSPATP